MVLSQLESLLNMYDEVSSSLDTMREYKDGEVEIRSSEVRQVEEMAGDRIKRVDIVIKGTVEKVMATPAGFMLTDVEKFMDRAPNVSEDQIHRADAFMENIPRKFVSFNSIEEINFISEQGD